MKYYIIKPKSHKISSEVLIEIGHLDAEAELVSSVEESDIVVLQKGWTRSAYCIEEKEKAERLGKVCREGYLYTEKVSVKLNSDTRSCGGYISKQDTVAAILKHLGIKDEKYLLPAEKAIVDVIKKMPEMPLNHKTGKWIDDTDTDGYYANYSEC